MKLQMITLSGDSFRMGSDRFYPDERPSHERSVASFKISAHPVTNQEFASFVEDTGYVTVAEEPLSQEEFPDLAAEDRVPGAMVFTPTDGPVDLSDWRQWWRWVPGAKWSDPFGSGSGIATRLDHPVVQIAYRDAIAFADWAGARLPTEAEWEYAARGGLVDTDFAWGNEARPGGELMANHWQGKFPHLNTGASGWAGTSPVGTFPPNRFGLFDMTGNVWEWTTSSYTAFHFPPGSTTPDRGRRANLLAPDQPREGDPSRRVLKGGSHLCAPEYCLRYRPSARSPQSEDTSMTHIGFRVSRDL